MGKQEPSKQLFGSIERFPVEEGQILAFARAIGDPNPVYADPEAAKRTEVGGIIAPPTFVQASAHFDPDYLGRPRIGEPWLGSGRGPTGLSGASPAEAYREYVGDVDLHAEMHFEYHRPIRPGDVLHTTVRPGARWEKSGRSGTLLFSEIIIEYRDEAEEPVVTNRWVAVRTKPAEEGS